MIDRDSAGLAIAVRAVKIDAGEAFNFDGQSNQFIQSFNSMVETIKLKNKKNIQFGNSQPKVIKWNNLTVKQRTAFLNALQKGVEYLKNRNNLKELIHRDGEFDCAFKANTSPFSAAAADTFVNKWFRYLELQELLEVYGELFTKPNSKRDGLRALSW